MLIYEVNLQVDNSAAEEMAVWMKEHIREMLRFSGFERAAWYQRNPDSGRQQWTVQYHVATRRDLDAYFEQHADRMRQDGLDRFGGRFTADRRILYEREVFGEVDQ